MFEEAALQHFERTDHCCPNLTTEQQEQTSKEDDYMKSFN
jgi:hypothetical protein